MNKNLKKFTISRILIVVFFTHIITFLTLSAEKNLSKTTGNDLTISEIIIPFNRITDINYWSMNQLDKLRNSLIKDRKDVEIFSIPRSIIDNSEVYRFSDERKQWVNYASIIFQNPYHLAFITYASHVDIIGYTESFSPVISFDKKHSFFKVTFSTKTAKKWHESAFYYEDSKGILRIQLVNSLAAGLKYCSINRDRSKNIDLSYNTSSDSITGGVLRIKSFYHTGRYDDINISPKNTKAWIRLLKENSETVISLKLWESRPISNESDPDYNYEIIIPAIY